jgi:hypothetical protein
MVKNELSLCVYGVLVSEKNRSKKNYQFKDKHGSLSVVNCGNILRVNLNGACGAKLTTFYIETLKEIAPKFGQQKWGLLFNSKEYQAATPEAEELFHEFCLLCIELGCRCESYCLGSPLAISQIRKMRIRYGNKIPLENVIFDTEADAEAYLLGSLEKLAVKTP